jgi:hypothetical protein
MLNKELHIKPEHLHVDIENILKGMGMQITDADSYLMELIDNSISTGLQLVQPKACFAIFENPQFDLTKKTITIEGKIFKTGAVVCSMLKRSEAIALFIATAGPQIENLSKKEMAAGNGLEGLIFNLVGSELAENLSELLHLRIAELVNTKGQNVSNRFSPGYCNWPVTEQLMLFELLSNMQCGVSLSSSSLMTPVKSVSGIIGIGKNLRRASYKCNICNDKHCIMRRQNS